MSPSDAERQTAPPAANALERVFQNHCAVTPDSGAACLRLIHVFQCGMVSEAALQDLLCDSMAPSWSR